MNKNDGVPDPAHVLLIPTAMSWIWDTKVDDLPVKSEQKRPEPRCVAVRHPPAAVSTTARAVIARKGLERSKNSLRYLYIKYAPNAFLTTSENHEHEWSLT